MSIIMFIVWISSLIMMFQHYHMVIAVIAFVVSTIYFMVKFGSDGDFDFDIGDFFDGD